MARSRVVVVAAMGALAVGAILPQVAEGAATDGRSGVTRTITIPARTCGPLDGPSCRAHGGTTVTIGAPKPVRGAQEVVPAACSEEAFEGATCGRVEVPLERDAPNNAGEEMVSIYFELYTHSNPGPAQGVILPNFGGPGGSTTGERGFAMALFGPNLDTHDLLLIDERGMGQSEAIDCPEMEGLLNTLEQVVAAENACLSVLGDSADDYSSGDIAEDYRAVVDEHGYAQVDLFGLSYGGLKMIAFAARYPDMVRSVVLDSPFSPQGVAIPAFTAARANEIVDLYVRYCERSRACSAQIGNPQRVLLDLIDRVQAAPVAGRGVVGDLAGSNRLSVTIDENALLELMALPNFGLTTPELIAAAEALNDGDRKPLLRVGAETKWVRTLTFDDDPAVFSLGAQYANACADTDAPWDWNDDVSGRLADYDAALLAMPPDAYGPFTPNAADSMIFDFFGKRCIGWDRPSDPTPAIPAGADLPDVPVMVLWGDLDFLVPRATAAAAAALFPAGQLYVIPEAGHTTVNPVEGGPCVLDDVNAYLDTVTLPVEVCARRPLTHPGVGGFPMNVSDASLANVKVSDANEAGVRGRRSAVLAVRTLMDSLRRGPIAFGSGPCLRGGRYETNYEVFPPVMKAIRCRYARDVAIQGKATWSPLFFGGDGALSSALDVRRKGRVIGQITIEGAYWGTAYAPRLRIRGRLGGAKVVFSLPST